MKSFITKVHLWLSVPFGLIIALVCATGAILVFEEEILELSYPERYFVKQTQDKALPISVLIMKARTQLPDSLQINGIQISGEADRTYRISTTQGTGYFINPYSGEITARDERSRFFRNTLLLHRFLLQPVSRHSDDIPWGKRIVGYSTLAFTLILTSGLIIWIPRNLRMLKNRLCIQTKGSRHRLFYDLHVSGGFYACLLLFAMALTGLTWSFPWYRNIFYGMLGATPQIQQKEKKKQQDGQTAATNFISWDKALNMVGKFYSSYKSISITDGNIAVSVHDYGNTRARDRYFFDPQSGMITGKSLYEETPQYSKMRGWIWSVHTGHWGGMTTRILSFLACLAGVVLVGSGYYLYMRKYFRKLNRHKESGNRHIMNRKSFR